VFAQITELSVPASGTTELSAAILQLVVTLGLSFVCAVLYNKYRKPVYAWWCVAWALYVIRLLAIVAFLDSRDWFWLYWHQVLTGWTGLAVLATAIVFARGHVRKEFAIAAIFPPLWSFIAIYELDSFKIAVFPAVIFLSIATLATAVVFWRYAIRVRSVGASVLATAFLLWGLHHLDYPFLRARGVWAPWGYYLDVIFTLAAGAGILLLVADDLRRGLDAMTTLSGELQTGVFRERPVLLNALLERPLKLPAVSGAALYVVGRNSYEGGAGVCTGWQGRAPATFERERLEATARLAQASTCTEWRDPERTNTHPFAALLPIPEGTATTSVLVIVGDARTPFAVLDVAFLTALGQQVGGALANSALTESLRARTADLEQLSARMVRQHEEERRRLSRELHDETAQVLSALKIELGVLRKAVVPADQHRIDDALTLVDVGIRSIRAVTNELRPALLDDLGLVPALRSLANDFAGRTGVATELVVPDNMNGRSLEQDAELALFRALQEGLANIVRHANARHVTIALEQAGGDVVLMIRDDGAGIQAPQSAGGMGLRGMRERVAALGGAMTIDSSPGAGTTLRISLPSRMST
jgi:signal transduction histidine kinase